MRDFFERIFLRCAYGCELVRSDIGVPVDASHVGSVRSLRDGCLESNLALLRESRLNDHADKLLQISKADAALGTSSTPVSASEFDLESTLLHPRFPQLI